MNDALLDFWYRLTSNILVSSEDMLTLQKALFSHAVLFNSSFFVPKKCRHLKQ